MLSPHKFSWLMLALSAASSHVFASELPSPKDVLGHTPGENYYLANYEDSISYFHALAAKSDKIKMFTAGQSTHGKTLEFAVISNPKNLAKWEEYKAISRKLADSRGLTDAEAQQLAKQSKIIVHIDGGMHASEVADHQLPIQLAHTLLTSTDPKIIEYLDKVIVVLWPTLNPDGQDMVVDWYRSNVGGAHETSPMPWLYQEYVGHDNNRDGYMLNMKESQVVTAAVQDNAPAIFYSQHQKAPFPARIWVPPFSDPISQNIDPMMRNWTSLIGLHMIGEFESERLPGAIAQAQFDNWYPGFLDYTHVFRHSISYFTETALHEYATPWKYDPEKFPEDRKDFKPQVMYPSPWKGGEWTIDDALHYMEVASLSTIDTAARYSAQIQYDRYQAGRNTIERFSNNGPYAYVVSAQQHDLSEAGALVDIMLKQQIEVYQLTKATELNGQRYPADSWVIPMNQPFAGLVQELFEKQHYPASFLDKDGLPQNLPYDTTGWTLPLQMGVDAVAVTQPLSKSQLSRLQLIKQVSLPSGISGKGDSFVLSQSENAAYKLVNSALAAGVTVAVANDKQTDSFVITAVTKSQMSEWASAAGVTVRATNKAPQAVPITAARVGLYRPWKPSSDEGWTRWLLEQYHFPLTTLHNADIQAGNLLQQVDVLIVPDIDLSWLMDGFSKEPDSEDNGGAVVDPVPSQYQGGIGADGAQALRDFVAQGGRLVAFNHAASAAIKVLGLPVNNVLENVGSDVFYCSGALLQLELNPNASPRELAGLTSAPVAMFSHGPAFTTQPGFSGEILASYPQDANPLQSGVLLHPEAINGKAAAVKVNYGKGEVFLYGFQPQWRGQSHGTYKFVFNTLYK